MEDKDEIFKVIHKMNKWEGVILALYTLPIFIILYLMSIWKDVARF